MAKVSINIDERSLKNGMAQMRIRINHRGTSAFISTGVYIEPQYFNDGSLYDPIHRKAYMAVEKRERVAELVKMIDVFLSDIDKNELTSLTAKDIKERVCAGASMRVRDDRPNKSNNIQQRHGAHGSADFMAWFDEYGRSRNTEKTRQSYAYAWKVLFDYVHARRMMTLTFRDIDYARLSDFATWLRATGKGDSTRHILESYVRAAYKEGQKCKMISRDCDPYYDYSIAPVPQKDIETMTAEQMHRLATVQLTEGLNKARDIAMMSFYLCGANLIDLYEMPPAKNGEVVFIRQKVQRRNQRQIHIHIESELEELLKCYKGDRCLLYFKERYASYDTFQRRVTRLLKAVSEKVKFDVNMARIRRTWASIAGSLDIADRVIDKSMGHVDSTVKDKHYEQYDWDRTARANRAIIDAILNVE